MNPFATFLLSLLNDLGIFALMTLAYGFVLRRSPYGPVRSAAIGCLFGLGAAVAMADTPDLGSGTFVDARGVALILAGPFGGAIAAVLTMVIAVAGRVALGGGNAAIGVATTVALSAMGLAYARLRLSGARPHRTTQFLTLGLLSCLPNAVMVGIPGHVGATMLGFLLPVVVTKMVGVLVLGHSLAATRQAVIATLRLEEQAFVDPLTGLPNRRSLERSSMRIIDDAARSKRPVAALVIDIDHFKRVNDRFGHDVGDAVLKAVAATVVTNLRAGDAIARYGGEEIVAVMPRTSLDEARRVAERIRGAIAREVFDEEADIGGVTASIGVAVRSGPELSFKILFKAADEALYRAKELGRNRVEVAAPLALAA
ncbi:GGDEF domain-containing protein [Jiella sonneratiae]|uniref:diguanylate cyclase n=1 Tax=Jiella sonneratiae TaxID=2816856 RepID=A0ABS3J9A0_9HYPH|nr:diguanylate cyclase [Jiella sonneratiae]MBO0906255.1 diguanylate cyclase [Jiella sonneratiae]